ncbi:MAG: DEAD/DEAH box helicase [Reichenbachiella sp.]
MTNFSELGLDAEVVQALGDLNITTPTEIQSKAIPYLISSDTDFIGLAQTGTGKTAAFGLPLINNIEESNNYCQSIILAPTRELAQQIAESIKTFAKYKRKVKIEVVFGGAPIMNQMKALKTKPQIVVATPGRLLDIIKRKALDISKLSYVVLDEADEMLNMGFKEELNNILEYSPKEKSTWLFSATMPSAIKHIVNTYMTNPHEISVKSGVEVNKNITHQYMLAKMSDKVEAIKRYMDMESDLFGVLFCRTKMDTQNIADELSRAGYTAEALHGDLTQKQRDVVMRRFKDGGIKLLVATDVAARGIDVNDLTHVIHHKLPDELEFYTHRSGRTARAGKKGISIVLLTNGEKRKLDQLERQLGISFERQMIPTGNEIISKRMGSWVEKIHGYELKKEIPEELKTLAFEKFEDLSKEDIISKFLSLELNKIHSSNSSDINVTSSTRSNEGRDSGRRGDRRERGERGERRETSSTTTMLSINIGKIDSMSKSELLDMVTDIASLEKGKIGKVEIEQKRSTLEVDNSIVDQIVNSFKDVSFDSREVTVKKDSRSPSRDQGRGGSRNFGGGGGRSSSSSRGRGGSGNGNSKGRPRRR